jgi:hypothetical protein
MSRPGDSDLGDDALLLAPLAAKVVMRAEDPLKRLAAAIAATGRPQARFAPGRVRLRVLLRSGDKARQNEAWRLALLHEFERQLELRNIRRYVADRELAPAVVEHRYVEMVPLDALADLRRDAQDAYNPEVAGREYLERLKYDIHCRGFEAPIELHYDPNTGRVRIRNGSKRLMIAWQLALANVPVTVIRGSSDWWWRWMHRPGAYLTVGGSPFPEEAAPTLIGLPTADQRFVAAPALWNQLEREAPDSRALAMHDRWTGIRDPACQRTIPAAATEIARHLRGESTQVLAELRARLLARAAAIDPGIIELNGETLDQEGLAGYIRKHGFNQALLRSCDLVLAARGSERQLTASRFSRGQIPELRATPPSVERSRDISDGGYER